MSKLFPLRSSPDVEEREPELLELDDERTDEVFDALGSATARQLLLALHEEPRPASELTDVVDTTIQNVQYHLTKLEAADLVRVVDTWHSENGSEMKVYAPSDEALVLFAGRDPERSLRRILRRLVGAVAPLLVGATALALYLQGQGAPTPTGEPVATPTPGAEFASGDAQARRGETTNTTAVGDVEATGFEVTVNESDGNVTVNESAEVVTQTPPAEATDAAGAALADPWLAAALFVAGGLVALAGLAVVDRVLD